MTEPHPFEESSATGRMIGSEGTGYLSIVEPDTKKFEVMTSAPEPRSSDEAMELCKNLLLFTLARNDSFDRAQQLWTSRGLPRHLFQQAVWDVLAWQSSDDDLGDRPDLTSTTNRPPEGPFGLQYAGYELVDELSQPIPYSADRTEFDIFTDEPPEDIEEAFRRCRQLFLLLLDSDRLGDRARMYWKLRDLSPEDFERVVGYVRDFVNEKGSKKPKEQLPIGIPTEALLAEWYKQDLPSRGGLLSMPIPKTWRRYCDWCDQQGEEPCLGFFHDLLRDLAEKSVISLTPHDEPSSLPEEDRELLFSSSYEAGRMIYYYARADKNHLT